MKKTNFFRRTPLLFLFLFIFAAPSLSLSTALADWLDDVAQRPAEEMKRIMEEVGRSCKIQITPEMLARIAYQRELQNKESRISTIAATIPHLGEDQWTKRAKAQQEISDLLAMGRVKEEDYLPLKAFLKDQIEKYRKLEKGGDPDALTILSQLERRLSNLYDQFERIFERIRAGEFGESAAMNLRLSEIASVAEISRDEKGALQSKRYFGMLDPSAPVAELSTAEKRELKSSALNEALTKATSVTDAEILLERGADVKAHGVRVLGTAIYENNLPLLKKLLREGASPFDEFIEDLPKAFGYAIERASRNHSFSTYKEMLTLLLENLKTYPTIDWRYWISRELTWAIGADDSELLTFLLDHGANGNHVEWAQPTPLHFAIEEQNLSLVDFLLKRGADPATKDYTGQTALEYAKKKGFEDIVKILEDHLSSRSRSHILPPLSR